MKRNRALLALLPAAMVAGLLTSCSASPTSAIDGVECAPEGDVSKSLEFTGKFGAGDLTLDTKTPIETTSLQASTLIKGDGEQVKEKQLLTVQLAIFSGASGELMSSEEAPVELSAETLPPVLLQPLSCSSVGDRIAMVAPSSEVFGPDAGVEPTESVVLVLDLKSAEEAPVEPGTLEPGDLLEKAGGVSQELPSGSPTVVLGEDGSPTITMPEGVAPPEVLTVETLIKGDGEEVKEGDRVYVHYRGVIWRTGEEFDSSWSRGAPIDFLTTGVIGGFSKALVGQTVGSQVMSIVPAEDGGYGAQRLTEMGHEPDDVMVFVLDILGTAHAE